MVVGKGGEGFEEEQKSNCPAFCDKEGYMLKVQAVESIMHPILRQLQKQKEFLNYTPSKIEVENRSAVFGRLGEEQRIRH